MMLVKKMAIEQRNGMNIDIVSYVFSIVKGE
jgi:hypothetical protein